MGKKGVIDRFEGDWAVIELEDGAIIDIPISNLPSNVSEGSLVLIKGNKATLLAEDTRARRRYIDELMEELFED